MEFLTATVGAPLVLGLLCVGVGLLVDHLAGGWVPAALLPALGLAGLIGLTQLTVAFPAVAPVTVVVAPLVAAVGLWLARGRLRDLVKGLRRTPWPLLAGVGAYLVAIAPVLLAGRA